MKYSNLYFYLILTALTCSNLIEITEGYDHFYTISEIDSARKQKVLDVYTESRVNFERAMMEANERVLNTCALVADVNKIQCDLAKINFSRKLKGLEIIYDPQDFYELIQKDLRRKAGIQISTDRLLFSFASQTIFGIFICIFFSRRGRLR